MKMHKRAMKRHTKHVESLSKSEVEVRLGDAMRSDEIHIVYTFPDGATSRVVMSNDEAEDLRHRLFVALVR